MGYHRPIPELTEEIVKRFWNHVDIRGPDDCWEWKGVRNNGDYGSFNILYITYTASRIAWTIKNVDPGELEVHHTCDNPPCMNPSHLSIGTPKNNSNDRDDAGHTPKGEQHSCAKLTEKEAKEILDSNEPRTELAAKYSVCLTTIGNIKTRGIWKHLEGSKSRNVHQSITGVKGVQKQSGGCQPAVYGTMSPRPIPSLTEEVIKRFWSHVDTSSPNRCWEWQGSRKDGYGIFIINDTKYKAHRVAYTIKNGDPGKKRVCHGCDNPPCVNPSHLSAGTSQYNADEMVARDRQPKGEQHGSAKLTEKEAQEILNSNEPRTELAAAYGVGLTTIQHIKTGQIWKHLNGVRDIVRRNPTGVMGVRTQKCQGKTTGRFVAGVYHSGKQIHLGTFATIPEAEAAVVAKRTELGIIDIRFKG